MLSRGKKDYSKGEESLNADGQIEGLFAFCSGQIFCGEKGALIKSLHFWIKDYKWHGFSRIMVCLQRQFFWKGEEDTKEISTVVSCFLIGTKSFFKRKGYTGHKLSCIGLLSVSQLLTRVVC